MRIMQLYIRCDEIVLELRHGDFPAYLLIACAGRIFLALLKPTRTGTHIQCLLLSALSKFSVSTTMPTTMPTTMSTTLQRMKANDLHVPSTMSLSRKERRIRACSGSLILDRENVQTNNICFNPEKE